MTKALPVSYLPFMEENNMDILKGIIFIVAFIPAIMLVNKAQQLNMKLIGANTMFFSGKKKVIAIVVVWLIISGILLSLFGLV